MEQIANAGQINSKLMLLYKQCTRYLVHPIDTVNNKEFRHLINLLEPKYTPPDRKTIMNNYLPELYMREKQRIERQMERATHFAITTDGWTSRANDSYVALTVHYIDEEWSLQSHLLETHQLAEAHTGENVATDLESMLTSWNPPITKLGAFTTDNAANIKLAIYGNSRVG